MDYITRDSAIDPRDVRDKALGLRESVNAARARMSAQRDQLARLRAEVTVLRELAALGVAPPAVSSIPSPLPSYVPAPVVKVAAPDSAPVAVPFRTDLRPFARQAVPYAAIFIFAVAFQLKPAPRPVVGLSLSDAEPVVPKPIASASSLAPLSAEDDGADQALLLVNEWKLPGDERTLVERFDNGVQLPGAQPAWTAERTGDRVYRVSYRSPEGTPSYDFDVDLDARRVDPTPDTAELLAPRLTARR